MKKRTLLILWDDQTTGGDRYTISKCESFKQANQELLIRVQTKVSRFIIGMIYCDKDGELHKIK